MARALPSIFAKRTRPKKVPGMAEFRRKLTPRQNGTPAALHFIDGHVSREDWQNRLSIAPLIGRDISFVQTFLNHADIINADRAVREIPLAASAGAAYESRDRRMQRGIQCAQSGISKVQR